MLRRLTIIPTIVPATHLTHLREIHCNSTFYIFLCSLHCIHRYPSELDMQKIVQCLLTPILDKFKNGTNSTGNGSVNVDQLAIAMINVYSEVSQFINFVFPLFLPCWSIVLKWSSVYTFYVCGGGGDCLYIYCLRCENQYTKSSLSSLSFDPTRALSCWIIGIGVGKKE